MAKSLTEHVAAYNLKIDKKIARLEKRILEVEADVDSAQEEYEAALAVADVELAAEKRSEFDRLNRILEKVQDDLADTVQFEAPDLMSLEIRLDDLRRLGGARKAWGEWITVVPMEPRGRMSTERRDEIRQNEEEWRSEGNSPRDLRKQLGGNKRRFPQQEHPRVAGRVFTHKEIRALEAENRRSFAIDLLENEYPAKVVYDVTGLSKFMQDKLRAEAQV
jgi:hypothetical protein